MEAAAVVLDRNMDAAATGFDQHAYLGGVGMFGDVVERLLDEAEDRHFIVGRQPAVDTLDHQIDLEAILFAELLHIAPKRRHQPQVIQDHWAQVEDEAPRVL